MDSFKIVIFHLTLGWGGAEQTSCNIANALSNNFFKMILITNSKRFLDLKLGRVDVVLSSFQSWFKNWRNIYEDIVKIKNVIQIVKPHVVIAMMPYAAFLTSVAKRLSPHPFIYVASPRGSCSSYLKHFVRSRKDKIRYRIFF